MVACFVVSFVCFGLGCFEVWCLIVLSIYFGLLFYILFVCMIAWLDCMYIVVILCFGLIDLFCGGFGTLWFDI